jgi:hypothetical protein
VGTAYTFYIGSIIVFFLKTKIAEQRAKMSTTPPSSGYPFHGPPRAHHKSWTLRDKVLYVIVAGLVGTAYTFYFGSIILFFLKTKIAEQMTKMPATIPTTTSMSEESDSYFLPLVEDVLDKVRNDPASTTHGSSRVLQLEAIATLPWPGRGTSAA